jgi:hypothetical protein
MQVTMEELRTLIVQGKEPMPAQCSSDPVSGTTQIVVLDRGFVYVGKVQIVDQFVNITEARNVRVWGTTNGLGELVNGPTKDTKLDQVGNVVAPLRAVVHFIACKQGW